MSTCGKSCGILSGPSRMRHDPASVAEVIGFVRFTTLPGVRFMIEGGIITRAGLQPSVAYVEGCW